MTPKEKAMDLVLKYHLKFPTHNMVLAKDFALICMEEVIKLSYDYNGGEPDQYLLDVQKEIENMKQTQPAH
jgi:hypothetical protein